MAESETTIRPSVCFKFVVCVNVVCMHMLYHVQQTLGLSFHHALTQGLVLSSVCARLAPTGF